MDEKDDIYTNLVHLTRLALAGRPQDIHLFVRRLSRRIRGDQPKAADQLDGLLREAPSRQSPLRNDQVAAVPVDLDSRLQLVRHEYPVILDVQPVWDAAVLSGLQQVVSERSREDELRAAGLQPTKSMLFTGPPGVGKTLAARWVAHQLHRPLLILDLSAVMSSFLGRTGVNVRQVLDYAKSIDCALLLDELDAIAKRRDDAAEIGELKRLVTVLLQEIDDWPSTGLLVAATNHPDLLDPAVWRRFDTIVRFPMPTDSQVGEAVGNLLGSDEVEPAIADALIIMLAGKSFSEIERDLLRVRRESLIAREPLSDRLARLIREGIDALPRNRRRLVAAKLQDSGMSQREVSRLTGVSRDTMRKAAERAKKGA